MRKLRNSVNGHGDVKIGEYHNRYLCSSSIPDCSSIVCLLSLKYQRGKRVEHPFPACCNSLSFAQFATVPWCARETREAAGTSQLQKGKRKNLQPTAGGVRKSLSLIIFPALNYRGFDLTQSSAFPALLQLLKLWTAREGLKRCSRLRHLHQMEFTIDRTCLYDTFKAICSEKRQKKLCCNSKINFGDPSLKIK